MANHGVDLPMYNHSWLCRKFHSTLPENLFLAGLPNFDGFGSIGAIIAHSSFDNSCYADRKVGDLTEIK